MTNLLKNMNVNKVLALLAVLLGLIAAFAGNPYLEKNTDVNTEVALSTLTPKYQMTVNQLADEIIKGDVNFRLIDIRAKEKYSEYFIPGAINLENNALLESGLLKNEKIILYADNDTLSTRAWYLLKQNGFNSVFVLSGGINNWEENILFPVLKKDAGQNEVAEFSKSAEISKFFGGTPDNGGVKVERKRPVVKAPVPVNLSRSGNKKAREGC